VKESENRLWEKVLWEGVLSLEEWIEDFTEDGFFKIGLLLVVGGTDKEEIRSFLSVLLERDLALFDREDVLEYGLALLIDGEDREYIGHLLDLLIEREHDPWKKRLARAKKEAVLSIQGRGTPRMLVQKLLAYFDKHVLELEELLQNKASGTTFKRCTDGIYSRST